MKYIPTILPLFIYIKDDSKDTMNDTSTWNSIASFSITYLTVKKVIILSREATIFLTYFILFALPFEVELNIEYVILMPEHFYPEECLLESV